MKAVVQHRYGAPDVLRIEDVARPVPKDDEILIRVRAATVSQTDTHARGAHPFFWRLVAGLRRPKRWQTLGVDLAGEVEAVGSAVTGFEVGDAVFGSPTSYFGTHAEFVCSRTDRALALKPAGLSFEEAAAVYDGGSQALSALRQGDVKAGSRVLIYGASGSLGTAAVQLAKHLGAHVTGVTSTKHVELVRSLGADEVIDYTQQDFAKAGRTYDVIIDAVGKTTFRRSRRALDPDGVYVETDGFENVLVWIGMRLARRKRLRFATGGRSREYIDVLKQAIEAGAYRPVIDRVYPMDQVADAHRYVEAWHKTGNVVLTIP
ncbi:MAG: NAD(P)-dependent alcohol dehydrogenase [Chloroflexota bacterium]